MKPPVALFKKQIMKLYLFLKTNSQVSGKWNVGLSGKTERKMLRRN